MVTTQCDNEDMQVGEIGELGQLRAKLQCQQINWCFFARLAYKMPCPEVGILGRVRGNLMFDNCSQLVSGNNQILSDEVCKDVLLVVKPIELEG